MNKVLVIGSGAAGATIAKELQGKFDVTILEAGNLFRSFTYSLPILEKFRTSGLFFDERQIKLLFPVMQIRKTYEKMVLVNGVGTGGTTTIATGNALRMDQALHELGIDLTDEFNEIYNEIPISISHRKQWRQITRQLFEVCERMGLNPQPTPKMGNYEHCSHCGRCIFGCPKGVKWDSRHFIADAVAKGAKLTTGCRIKHIVIANGKAKGVVTRQKFSEVFIPADLIILAAGGFGTPIILQNSGVACTPELFVDPVLCVAAKWQNALQNKEVSMPFFVQQDHIMLSPYFDYLSFFFNKQWRMPGRNILSLMIKLADSPQGRISGNRVDKTLTEQDKRYLQNGIDLCGDIFGKLGINRKALFLGTINAGHPGGMLPLTENEATTLHHPSLPENLYIADSTLLPKSLGNPPILTIIALAKRVGKRIMQ
jgi:choline dehydrogenase-like flavoprotein